MKTLVIRSSEWARGKIKRYDDPHQVHTNWLFDPYRNKSCCLGIHAFQCGISKAELRMEATPDELSVSAIKMATDFPWAQIAVYEEFNEEYVITNCSREINVAMKINDDRDLTDDERIAQLRPVFAKHGWEIEWRPDE